MEGATVYMFVSSPEMVRRVDWLPRLADIHGELLRQVQLLHADEPDEIIEYLYGLAGTRPPSRHVIVFTDSHIVFREPISTRIPFGCIHALLDLGKALFCLRLLEQQADPSGRDKDGDARSPCLGIFGEELLRAGQPGWSGWWRKFDLDPDRPTGVQQILE